MGKGLCRREVVAREAVPGLSTFRWSLFSARACGSAAPTSGDPQPTLPAPFRCHALLFLVKPPHDGELPYGKTLPSERCAVPLAHVNHRAPPRLQL